MRKEVIWAIIGGILIGLVVALGIYRVNKRIKNLNTTPKTKVDNTVKTKSDFKITLITPENEDVQTEEQINVQGLTKPNSIVIVSAEEKDYKVTSDAEGNFSAEITLIGGVNQIKVTAFDQNLKSEEKVVVVYSSAFEKIDLSQNIEATGSSIRAKVQEKVNELLNKPKSYIGTVVDITDTSIEIKSKNGEIRQIAIDNTDLTIVKSFPTSKEVKVGDIAIGDAIVAMGYRDENQVLGAQRILIIEKLPDTDLAVVLGTISKVTKNSVFIDATEYIFEKPKQIKFTSLEIGQQIIIVGNRSLFVLE